MYRSMGDLFLTVVLYLTRETEHAVLPIILRYAECFYSVQFLKKSRI